MKAGADAAMREGNERTVLAYLMSEHDACDKFLCRIPPDSLLPVHRNIVNAIHDVFDERENVNLVTVANRLEEKDELVECGGRSGITDIATSTTSEELAESALDYVLDFYRGCKASRIGQQLAAGEIASVEAEVQLAELNRIHQRNGSELSFRSPAQILAMPRNRKANFLGDHLLGLALSLVIAGIGGIGKSRLFLQLLVAFILERAWCGIETHHTKGKPWMLVQTQNSVARLQDDLERLQKYAGDDWELVEKNLIVHTLETDRDLMLHLSDAKNARDLESAIRRRNPIGVAYDPLNEIAIGDLSKDVDMMATCQEIGRISRAGNPERAILIATHALTGLAGMKKAFGFEAPGFGRNSKVLQSWARAFINVIPATEDCSSLILTCGKNNNGKMFEPLAVQLNTETMIYEADSGFDVEELRQRIEQPNKHARIPPRIVTEIFWPQKELNKAQLAKLVVDEVGCGKSRSYSLIDEALRDKYVKFSKVTRTYAKKSTQLVSIHCENEASHSL
jgi:hypothetical protein